ncbi:MULTISPECIES: hypothetical protein [Lactococcus]|uniref:hypothetical protein n=1 Tax=Lactococcus TaxID=1357 RepID=UPI001A9040FD|nr:MULTISPECIES: hypothetical protein [Lactococcus]QSQ99548.1 hypothetical protein J0J34_05515 [Lactococcus garvieae]
MSKDTAQQEVEKVCFAYEKAGKTGNKKDWGKFYDLEDSLINKVEVANQTKLSIPKKIAEHDWMKHLIECSNLSQFEFERYDDCLSKDDEQFLEWVKTDKNENILYIYLASKALGVELVEVEG